MAASKKPMPDDPPWFKRMAATVGLKRRIGEALFDWPTNGEDTTSHEQQIRAAFNQWKRDMRRPENNVASRVHCPKGCGLMYLPSRSSDHSCWDS